MKDLKQWLKGASKSFTMWFNVTGIPLIQYLEANSELWQDWVGEYSWVVIIIMNVILRMKTNNSLKEK
jgi:fumarate reductase subunit C